MASGKSQGITKVTMIYLLGTLNVIVILSIVVKIFQSDQIGGTTNIAM